MDDLTKPGVPSKGIVERAKAIVMSPKSEWPVIAAESDSVATVFVKYAVPLAAIGPISQLIGSQLFGYSALGISYRPDLTTSITTAITGYVLTLAGVFLVAFVANFLSPKFGGKDSYASAFKWCAYAFTASWLVGIVGIIPMLGILGLLGLYSLYLLYVGASPMMGVPEDKSMGYTVVTIIAAIVTYLIVGAIAAAITASFVTASAPTIAGLDGDQIIITD